MAKTWKNFKDESKTKNWGQEVEGNLCIDQIKLGAILRIADAVEKMASSYDNLRKEGDYWKLQLEESRELIAFYEKRIAGLKGYIKRLRKKK